ncbi:D-alanyl-D-alanine carboxypeptidase/D-alanyl-D-alanine endopeptidase [Sphingomonas baiyangensis]|uniref:D-alanyl-D-alanine carboxypeptidase/D-alanyl-D-alanine-endopeptidase n=1 Tax=Sphingomonas baiyangensis TaxID=2572576 RepID=A0A4V5PYG8_9SPHN|nr:D-alanyl-D-alanine carboxypeptidase/D-alanyl-D-alanine-endopeptidase [Sphingomonas baiyangensis]TKD51068.1 D-alanyl-D-alanine carboxypeptidase/D-alanyl-D-alanine-endopeptidase [Sphingomonas baiyangensis]
MPHRAALIALLVLPACAAADQAVPRPAAVTATAPLADPGRDPPFAGTRWGLLVVDAEGRDVVAIEPDGRFLPASNTKLATVAASFHAPLPPRGGTRVAFENGDVVLWGAGDPLLSDAADCASTCVATLADAVAARHRRVRDVVGDDRLWQHDRWGGGMAWNNLWTRSGTATSALTLNANTTWLVVRPGVSGAPAVARIEDDWFTLDNRAVTGSETALSLDRQPDSRVVRLSGTIAADASEQRFPLGIDDPAAWTAHRFAVLLGARGVAVTGSARARHRIESVAPNPPAALATLEPSADETARTRLMKDSQNLFAEMALRRLGQGSAAAGLDRVAAMFSAAGAPRAGWDLSDGSGMSTYNRLSPRAVVALLRWADRQPWAKNWRATLPVAATDGTLARRFIGTPLAGRLWAKTGSLNATSALSGYFEGASGRRYTFAFFANDVPANVPSVTARMDAELVALAAQL